MMKKLCPVHKVSYVLVFIGALNWGLVGFFKWNLVTAIFGSMPTVERVIYALVGLAAISMLFVCKCKQCGGCCKAGGKGDSCCSK